MSNTTQYHLKGKGFSGRAVRVRELDAIELEENLTAAAKMLSGDAQVLELKKVEWRNGIKRMVVEITDPCDDPLAEGVKWRKVVPGMLDDLGAVFKGKDMMALEAIFREMHEVTPTELEAITGKALPVSGG
jgi:hypothetical protein